MSLLQSIQLEHLSPSYTIHIALYRNVTNAAYLQQQLLAGNTDFEYAFIDASVILSPLHILSATYRAINDLISNRLKTRNVHSEIVFSLSPNNNIAESFRRFGIPPSTPNTPTPSRSPTLLILKITTPATPLTTPDTIQIHLSATISGEQIPFSAESLREATDLGRVKKIYKLNSFLGGGGKKGVVNGNGVTGEEEERKELEMLVLGCMALRGSMN